MYTYSQMIKVEVDRKSENRDSPVLTGTSKKKKIVNWEIAQTIIYLRAEMGHYSKYKKKNQ